LNIGYRRLLKKRELLSYYLLCREKDRVWNIGEAVDLLVNELFLTRKTAFNIVKFLRKMGLLITVDTLVVKCLGFNEYFDELLRNYKYRKRRGDTLQR